jgi:hypothetical protein
MGRLNKLKYEKQMKNQRLMGSLNQLKFKKTIENHCVLRFMGSLNQLKCEKQLKIIVFKGLWEA